MNQELSSFAARLRERFFVGDDVRSLHSNGRKHEPPHVGSCQDFNTLALELFAHQFRDNAAYQKICQARGATPETVEDWTQIPAVPTAAFKELELSCLLPHERTAVFHSSGTTGQKPSRHFHYAESLALYEASSWTWFEPNVLPDLRFPVSDLRLTCLTPPPPQVPYSSLVHMFDTIRRKLGGASVLASRASFPGKITADGSWVLDFDAVLAALNQSQFGTHQSLLFLGTAFSFVHLVDFLSEHNLRFQLPPGSRVMETGGYKNRSRTMPKEELHALITERLGIPAEAVFCEYGMSELSSQAYDFIIHHPPAVLHPRIFRFAPWARVQIISPETGRGVADGETGLIRVFDLANVFSVMAVQTEDLGVRRGDGFELIGRAQLAEPRGCSLMNG